MRASRAAPLQVIHREGVARGEVRVDAGHPKPRVVGKQRAIAFQESRFEQVVGLLAQLALRLGGEAGDIEINGQQIREPEQRRDIVHVAGDRPRDARVLDLDRELAIVGGSRAVHLADGCGRDRLPVEFREAPLPIAPVLARQHACELGRRHRVGTGAQDRERLRELGRQQVVTLEREQLAELHCRAAQVGKPLGEPLRIACIEERAARSGGSGAAQAPDQASEHELRRREAESDEAPEPACGDARLASCRRAAHPRRSGRTREVRGV